MIGWSGRRLILSPIRRAEYQPYNLSLLWVVHALMCQQSKFLIPDLRVCLFCSLKQCVKSTASIKVAHSLEPVFSREAFNELEASCQSYNSS